MWEYDGERKGMGTSILLILASSVHQEMGEAPLSSERKGAHCLEKLRFRPNSATFLKTSVRTSYF
jgi:hypothetical protein